MKITYDKEVDAMYIYFKKGRATKTTPIGGDFIIDVDKKKNIIGLEVLNASRHIGGSKRKTEITIGNRSIMLPALAA